MRPPNLFGSNANLAALARRYMWTSIAVALLALVISLLEGFGVSLLIPLLSTFTGSWSVGSTRGVLGFFQSFAAGYNRSQRLIIVSSVILTFVLLKGVLQAVANTYSAWVEGRVGNDIRCALSERLQSVGYPFFLKHEPSRLVNIFTTESWKASDSVRTLLGRISSMAAATVFGVLLLLVSWRLSLLVVAGGLLARTLQKQTEAKLRELSHATVAANERLADQMLFTIFGARVIRLFNRQSAEQAQFAARSDAVRRSILRGERLYGMQGPLLEAVHSVLLLVVLLTAVVCGVSLPVLGAFLVLMNRLQPHLRLLEQSAASLASSTGHFNEVEWLLNASDKPKSLMGGQPFIALRDAIVFDHVSFEYGDRGEPALQEATFQLRRGRSTAIIGGSGAGKSTVVNLICRLLEPVSGAILVDGQLLSEISISDWLDSIAIAGQDIDLVDGTIAENISYGRRGLDQRTLERAARSAGADFFEQLPQGLETLVGSRGLSLSGGERQRIGIARALARDAQILILDEATNAIDHETEAGIVQTLDQLAKSITVIVISHRSSTLAFCDDAVVLHRGRVLETGPLPLILGRGRLASAPAGDSPVS